MSDFKHVRIDEMRGVINRARKDHPKVRRIGQTMTFGVKCQHRCSLNAEHLVTFMETECGLFAQCLDCASEEYRPTCRHVAAAVPLYNFYYGQQIEKAA